MSRVVLQTVLQGQRREFPLEERTVCRIGRGEQSTIVLSGDIQVSRNHAVVQHMNNGEYYLTDLSSRNGTLLNGRLVVSPTALRNGDIIRMGGYEFVFVQEEDAAPGFSDVTSSADSGSRSPRKCWAALAFAREPAKLVSTALSSPPVVIMRK